MIPSEFTPKSTFKPPEGLPQESKLVTYMNRSASAPSRSIHQAMARLSVDDSHSSASQQVRDYAPMNFYGQPPMMPESPGGSPPSVLITHCGVPQNSHLGLGSHMGGMPPGSHMGGVPPGPHMGGVPPGPHMGGVPPGPHMGGVPHIGGVPHMGSVQLGSHMGGGIPPGSHMMGVPPSSLMGGGIPQGPHMGGGAPQSSHRGSNVQQTSHMPAQQPTQMIHENVGGTTYFYPSDSINAAASLNASAEAACLGMGPPMMIPSPYATQMYIPFSTHMVPMPSKPGLAAMFYHPETIRAEVYERNEAVFLSQQDLRQFPQLPDIVEEYTQLIPLEGVLPHSMTSSYRVTHSETGDYRALRRLHSYNSIPPARLDIWKQINHPNVVTLLDYFSTKSFNDNSLLLLYSYHPACVTLMNKFLVGCGNPVSDGIAPYHDPFSSDPDAPRPYTHQKNAMLRAVASGSLLPESVIWSLIVQLTAGLRAIHAAGLAVRTLDPSKVILNGCRARIAWNGVADVLHPYNGDQTQAQQEDMRALGRLALSIACRTAHCDNMPASIDLLTRSYSSDLKNVIMFLLAGPPSRRTVFELMPMIGARFYTQVEALQRRSDAFEDLLAYEIDNGRLFRLLVKLAICNDRTDLNCDTSWAETGHRYLLKLFRDYIFHSVNADGRPWIDQAHIINCLNLLDGGAPDRVPLITRDEQSILVVSYAELKHCLEASFEEVMQAAAGP